VSWLLVLAVLAVIAVVMMTKDERLAVVQAFGRRCRQAITTLADRWTARRASERPLPLATTALAFINVWIFCRLLLGDGAVSDPATLIDAGASFGPRTTNGEWWRLIAALFVHAGPLHLLASLAGLIQVGCLTERLVGRLGLLFVYTAAGTLATLVSLYISPVTVTSGAAPAILGTYGLLAATLAWGLIRRDPPALSLQESIRLVPGISVFLVYTLVTGRLDRPAAIAAVAGLIAGLLLAKGRRERVPVWRHVAALTAGATVIVVGGAVPLRGIGDFRPALEHIVSVEHRTADVYRKAVDRFTKGKASEGELVALIDDAIVPELQAARAGLGALERLPSSHRPLVADVEEYFQLRRESWRLRADALRTSKMPLLQEADAHEWRALAALKRAQGAD
jgi:rhomboid protease GluP